MGLFITYYREIKEIQKDTEDSFHRRLSLLDNKLNVTQNEPINKKKTINDAKKWTSVWTKNNKLASNFMQIINPKTPK